MVPPRQVRHLVRRRLDLEPGRLSRAAASGQRCERYQRIALLYEVRQSGQNFAAYDYQISFDWTPTQFVTWKAEFTQRGSNVPYFTGPGGMTPPGGNQGAPGSDEKRFSFALIVHL